MHCRIVFALRLVAATAVVLVAAAVPKVAAAQDAGVERVRVLTRAFNGSGQKLFRHLSKDPGNVVISPYSIGTAMAMALAEERGFGEEDFAALHPGGDLGRRFLKVKDLMRSGDRVPRVSLDTPMPEAIHEMTRKMMGITAVVDAGDRADPGNAQRRRRHRLAQDPDAVGRGRRRRPVGPQHPGGGAPARRRPEPARHAVLALR